MTFLIPNFKGGIIGRSVLQDDEGKTNNESSTLKFLRKVRDNNKRNQLRIKTLVYWEIMIHQITRSLLEVQHMLELLYVFYLF